MVALERELAEPTVPAERAAVSADAIPLRLRRRGGTARQVVAMTLIGALILAVLASHDLSAWLSRLDGTGFGHALASFAERWDGMMSALGFAGPHERLRDAITRLLDRQW